MTTLTGFLLDRITEEEAAWSGGLNLVTAPSFAWMSKTMLRDCKAKRAIVEEYVSRDDDVDLMLGRHAATRADTRRQREWSGLRLAVHILAQPYADHPNYQPEWSADA